MRYPKKCLLTDSSEAVIREVTPQDKDLLESFYHDIPEQDRWFMTYDAAEPETLVRWFTGLSNGHISSVVALKDGVIAGHASLYTRTFGATRHVGRFRITVHPDFRKKRLGTWLLLDLIQLAIDKGLEILRMDMVSGIEDTAIEAVAKFDFFRYATLERYVKGPQGNLHDLVVMIKRLHQTWSDY